MKRAITSLTALTILLSSAALAHDSFGHSNNHHPGDSQLRYRLVQMPGFGDPRAINNFGIIAGFDANATSPGGYLWRHGPPFILPDTGTVVPLDTGGLNDRGRVVGFSLFTDNTGTQYIRGYIWRHAGYTVLDALPGGSGFSYATDINNRDEVVGYSYSAAGVEAVRWDHGTIESLGDLPGGTTDSAASAVNDRGTIVGTAHDDMRVRAFIWREGQMTALPIPPSAITSDAFDVSNADVVVGFYVDGGVLVPALWRNGALEQLPYFDSTYTSAYAASINESGDIVGLSAIGTTGVDSATLWHKGKAYNLNDLIADDDPLKSCVSLESANSINDRGQIAARGVNACENASNTVTFRLEPAPGRRGR